MHRAIACSIVLLLLAASALAQAAAPDSTDCTQIKAADRAEAKLKDWPALGRYHEDNTKVSLPLKNERRVVFIRAPLKINCLGAGKTLDLRDKSGVYVPC